jgi:hypothetical protein
MEDKIMGKWEPLLWILASGLGFIAALIGVESLKIKKKKK